MTSLVIVGDVIPGGQPQPDPAVGGSFAILQQADLTLGNMEGAITSRGAPAEKLYNLRAAPDCVAGLRSMGFTVMSVANNHSLDFGPDGFHDTLRFLREGGILPVGGGRDLREAWQPAIVTLDGLRVAVLGAASTLPPGFAAGEGRPGIAPIHVTETYMADPSLSLEQPGSSPFVHTRAWPEDVEAAQAAVRDARAQADFVIVTIHWGVPPLWRAPSQRALAEYQQPVGRALIEAGADLVAGHHPHSLQGIELYRGKPIFYSLGNFLFGSEDGELYGPMARNLPYDYVDQPDRQWSESAIVRVTVGQGETPSYEILAVLLDEAGYPHLLDGEAAEHVLRRLDALSGPLGGTLAIGAGAGRLIT